MVEILRPIPWDELRDQVRQVPLLKAGPDNELIYPYKNAEIVLRQVDPRELSASSFYLIERNLDFQRQLLSLLKSAGRDLFNLGGALEIQNSAGEIWRLMPPVVEVIDVPVRYAAGPDELDYSDTVHTVPLHIVNDGMHRVALARELGQKLQVIHVTGSSESYPYYALPNSWSDVKIFTDVPKSKREKKLYRREDCYALYRNFDVLGCGKPRNTGQGQVVGA